MNFIPFLAFLAFIFGSDPADVLLARLSPGVLPQAVTIQYLDPENYFVWTPIDGGLYWAQWGVHQNESGFWAVRDASVYRALDAVDDSSSEIHYTGTWDSLSGGGFRTNLGQTEHRSNDPAASLEFMVTGVESLFIAITQKPEGGYGRITINRGTSLVNGAGVERIQGYSAIDFYARKQARNQWVEVANNLDPSRTYVVQITPLGAHRPGSTGDTVYFDGYGSSCAQFSDSNGRVANDTIQVLNVGTNMGYAYEFRPDGATVFQLSGSDHNYEAIESVLLQDGSGNSISVDPQNPILTSPSIRLVQSGWARHPDTGTTNHAKVSMALEFTSAGVKQTTTHHWISKAILSKGYTGMMAGSSDMNRGYIAGGGRTVYSLRGDDGTEFGQLRSRMAVLFGTTHDFVLGTYIPDLVGVNGWRDSRRYLFIDDKTGGTNKIYFEGIGIPISVSPGDVWTSDVRFAIYYKPGFIPFERPER